jgi:chromosome segregation ATPase
MSQKRREVFEACDSLLKEGKKLSEITIEALAIRLRELGYLRGGNTPLTRYRKEWMEIQGFTKADKNKNLMGIKETSEGVLHATERFRQSVVEDVRKEYEEKFQAVLEKQAAVEEENTNLQTTLLDLTDENSELQHQLTDISDRFSTQAQALETSQTALIDLKAHFEMQAEKIVEQDTHWQKKYDDMCDSYKTHLDTIHAELKKQRTHHQQALHMLMDSQESQRHQWIVEKDELKTECQKTQEILDATKEQLTTLKTQFQQKAHECEQRETQQKAQSHAIDDVQAQFQACQERMAALTAENKQRQENQDMLQRIYNTDVSELKQTISTLQDTLNTWMKDYVKP